MHSQTNTLKGSVKYGHYLYINNNLELNYVNRYLGISVGDYYGGATLNELIVHDVFGIKAAYNFKIGNHISITPFLGVAYGWTQYSSLFLDSANFVNDKLVGGSMGFEYEQGKVLGPDMGVDLGYTFKNKHHQLFFESELILLTTPGSGSDLLIMAYEAVQFSFGYQYKF